MFYKDNKVKDLGRIHGFQDKQGALAFFSIGLGVLVISVGYAAYSFLVLFLNLIFILYWGIVDL